LARQDITDRTEAADSNEATERKDPTANTEPNEPIDPTDNADPTEPIESTEPLHAMQRTESSEASDHLDPRPAAAAIYPSWPARRAVARRRSSSILAPIGLRFVRFVVSAAASYPDVGYQPEGAHMRGIRRRRLEVTLTACAGLLMAIVPASTTAGGSTGVARSSPGEAHVLSTVVGGPSATPKGFAPATIRNEYGFNGMGSDANGNPIDGRGQIIGIVLWDYDPYLQSDMSKFLKTYSYLTPMAGLTATSKCTISRTIHTTPCFEVAYATGVKPPPMPASDRVEASLDVEWAHVTAEGADIVFVEAAGSTGPQLLVAVDEAVTLGATVVSMSWDQTGITAADNSHFDAPTAGFVSGSGDFGCPDNSGQPYPSESSYVLSVGGTQLFTDGAQTAWNKSGGAINNTESRPSYQLNWSVGPYRVDNDVSYNAVDYPITVKGKWLEAFGVSAGIPQWAGLIADADQDRVSRGNSVLAAQGLLDGIYLAAASHGAIPPDPSPAMFDDITTGSAGSKGVCHGSTGWDWPTGLGTPHADALVNELADL